MFQPLSCYYKQITSNRISADQIQSVKQYQISSCFQTFSKSVGYLMDGFPPGYLCQKWDVPKTWCCQGQWSVKLGSPPSNICLCLFCFYLPFPFDTIYLYDVLCHIDSVQLTEPIMYLDSCNHLSTSAFCLWFTMSTRLTTYLAYSDCTCHGSTGSPSALLGIPKGAWQF